MTRWSSRFRLSIFQVVVLATGIGSFLAWFCQDRTREFTWIESTLKYKQPALPGTYDQGLPTSVSRPWPSILRGGTNIEIENGPQLFSVSHRKGWDSYRYHFYSDFDGNEAYEIRGSYDDVSLKDSNGIDSAAKLAYAHGYNECLSQVTALLRNQSEQELRSEIAYKKANSLPILLIAIASAVIFLFSIRRKKSNRHWDPSSTDFDANKLE